MNRSLRHTLLVAWCVGVALFWLATIARSGGIFVGSLSVDFRSFWAATQAFLTISPVAAYDMPTLNRIIQHLAGYGGGGAALMAAPAPYPPPFFLIFAPFALVWPPLGFVGWTLLNLALAILAIRPFLRTATSPWIVGIMAVLFFPLAFSLYAGQPSGILLFGLAQVYRSLQAEQDWCAGLWLGVLLLKPQYAIGLVLVLLLKRRWRALAGAALAGAILAVLSLALIGVPGLLTYRSLLDEIAGFRSAPAGIAPNIMISWRGFLLNVLPGLTDLQGVMCTLVISALTLLMLPLLWREPWRPQDNAFDARMLATMIITLLAAYHSHIYGATLLLVPGASIAVKHSQPLLRWLLIGGALAPPFLLLVSSSTIIVATFLTLLMAATLATILGQSSNEMRFGRLGEIKGDTKAPATAIQEVS
jgi:hypothetical protein